MLPPSGRRDVLIVALALLALAASGVLSDGHPFDLSVYRQAALEVVGRTGDLYEFSIGPYPFTYPPFAALLMAPLALVPLPAGAAVWAIAQLGALGGIWWVALGRRASLPLVALLAATSAWLLEPVRLDLDLGQVNLVLGLAILLDLTAPTSSRWRGVLTGLAAAVKLTPLVFLVFLAVTRQWRALRMACTAFAGAAAVGLLVLPVESWRYWTDLVFHSSRVGHLEYGRNQSVLGMLVRLGADPDARTTTLLWLVAAGAVAVLGLAVASRCWQRGEAILAISVVGLVSVLASPISWTHHWVWCIPLGAALALALPRWTGHPRSAWVAVAWAGVFVLSPQSRLVPTSDGVELAWTAAQQLPGNGLVIAAIAVLLHLARLLDLFPADDRADVSDAVPAVDVELLAGDEARPA